MYSLSRLVLRGCGSRTRRSNGAAVRAGSVGVLQTHLCGVLACPCAVQPSRGVLLLLIWSSSRLPSFISLTSPHTAQIEARLLAGRLLESWQTIEQLPPLQTLSSLHQPAPSTSSPQITLVHLSHPIYGRTKTCNRSSRRLGRHQATRDPIHQRTTSARRTFPLIAQTSFLHGSTSSPSPLSTQRDTRRRRTACPRPSQPLQRSRRVRSTSRSPRSHADPRTDDAPFPPQLSLRLLMRRSRRLCLLCRRLRRRRRRCSTRASVVPSSSTRQSA